MSPEFHIRILWYVLPLDLEWGLKNLGDSCMKKNVNIVNGNASYRALSGGW